MFTQYKLDLDDLSLLLVDLGFSPTYVKVQLSRSFEYTLSMMQVVLTAVTWTADRDNLGLKYFWVSGYCILLITLILITSFSICQKATLCTTTW